MSNEGKTIISEGIDANYNDIINYAVFALILMSETEAVK
ncbi:MAG TPA: nucleotide modification associated domain-containing protein [Niabella sp.]|nr:nucleotide modification associated domain-containing protein [Niabella sp.]